MRAPDRERPGPRSGHDAGAAVTDLDALLEQGVAALARPRRATYRLQLGPALRFEDVGALAPYLAALGVSDAYLSPCFKSGPGSSQGYDVTDHSAFNPEVGSETTFAQMAGTLGAHEIGVILDIVPNLMGIVGDANPWWTDVLENGPSSPYARFFDIDWAPVKPELYGKVLLSVLPDQYGRMLESQQLRLEFSEGAFVVLYAGERLLVAPDSYAQVLSYRLETLGARLSPEDPHLRELQSILTVLEHLPAQMETDLARSEERLREKEIIKRRLAALVKESTEIREFLDDNVRLFNGTSGDPASFDLLDRLLSAQAYRLADWRVAGDEVNYRRFFDVNHLAAIRTEFREVFDASHRLVSRLVGDGAVTGLRVDHPDGLYAPGEYFRRLQEEALLGAPPAAWRPAYRARQRRRFSHAIGRWRRIRRRLPRGPSGSSARRSSWPTSACPSGGASRARQATISSDPSTASSWTAATSGR